jgi:hypothetical protein
MARALPRLITRQSTRIKYNHRGKCQAAIHDNEHAQLNVGDRHPVVDPWRRAEHSFQNPSITELRLQGNCLFE